MTDLFSDLFWFYLGAIVGWVLGIVAHEAGHCLGARVAGIEVRRIAIGAGPLLWRFRRGETSFELRLVPFFGSVFVYQDLLLRKFRSMLFVAGGALANVVVLIVLAHVYDLTEHGTLRTFIAGGGIAQLAIAAVTLIPSRAILEGADVGSDGRQLLRLMRVPNGSPTAAGLGLEGLLRGYLGATAQMPQPSAAASRVWHHLSDARRWTHEAFRREISRALMRELGRGLPRELELLALDVLVTDTLISGDEEFRPHLDAWSRRALELVPDALTLRGSRGAVLVECGRFEDGKAMLAPLVDAQVPFDRLLGSVFLALAECRLGERAEARRHLGDAREIVQVYGGKGPVALLIERAAREIEAT